MEENSVGKTGDGANLRLRNLQTPEGTYAMVALDQRESLRAMFPQLSEGTPVRDETLTDFKAAGVRALSSFASGILLDRVYGLVGPEWPQVADTCGLIIAADTLHHSVGGTVTHTTVDPAVTVDFLRDSGASGVKFLVIWQKSSSRADRARLITDILELAEQAGIASVIEAIVRPDGDVWSAPEQKYDAILSAAAEICALQPDLYKAEVPGYVEGDLSGIAEAARQLDAIANRDWVVLSNGVRQTDFAPALSEAVIGGAGGFLAGRAIWADIVGKPDQNAAFTEIALPRLRGLRQIVTGRAARA
jgi:sulfofructosephosphate aldolase